MYDSSIFLVEETYLAACHISFFYKRFYKILAVPILAINTLSLQHFVAYKLLIIIFNHCVYIMTTIKIEILKTHHTIINYNIIIIVMPILS